MGFLSPIFGNNSDAPMDDNAGMSSVMDDLRIGSIAGVACNAYDTMFAALRYLMAGKSASLKQMDVWLKQWEKQAKKIVDKYTEILSKIDDVGTSLSVDLTWDAAARAFGILNDYPILRRYAGEANYWYLYSILGLAATQGNAIQADLRSNVKEAIRAVLLALISMTDGMIGLEACIGLLHQQWGALYLKSTPLPVQESVVPNVTCAYYYKPVVNGRPRSSDENPYPSTSRFIPIPIPIPDYSMPGAPTNPADYYRDPSTWRYLTPSSRDAMEKAYAYWGSSYSNFEIPGVTAASGSYSAVFLRRPYQVSASGGYVNADHPLRLGYTFAQLDTDMNELGAMDSRVSPVLLNAMEKWQEVYEAQRVSVAELFSGPLSQWTRAGEIDRQANPSAWASYEGRGRQCTSIMHRAWEELLEVYREEIDDRDSTIPQLSEKFGNYIRDLFLRLYKDIFELDDTAMENYAIPSGIGPIDTLSALTGLLDLAQGPHYPVLFSFLCPPPASAYESTDYWDRYWDARGTYNAAPKEMIRSGSSYLPYGDYEYGYTLLDTSTPAVFDLGGITLKLRGTATFVTILKALQSVADEESELADEVGYSTLKGRRTLFPVLGVFGDLKKMSTWNYRVMGSQQFKREYSRISAGSSLYYKKDDPNVIIYKDHAYFSSIAQARKVIYHMAIEDETISYPDGDSFRFVTFPSESVMVTVHERGKVDIGATATVDASYGAYDYHYVPMPNMIPKLPKYVDPKKWSIMDMVHELYLLAYKLSPICGDNGARQMEMEDLFEGLGLKAPRFISQLPDGNGQYNAYAFGVLKEYSDRIEALISSIHTLKARIIAATENW